MPGFVGTVSHMRRLLLLPVLAALLFAAGTPAEATHSWGNYHWARTTSSFTLRLADNVSSVWDASLAGASADWSAGSDVLDTVVVPGTNSPKTCKPTSGRVEVCNSKYGRTGWLGIAQIWASGSHITQGVVKLNDTYFTGSYNTSAWRNFVTCQEVGHTFGLGHQDENFNNANLDSCMDYTNNPESNQHPNEHDFSLLSQIYAHADATTTVKTTAAASGAGHAQNDFGRAVAGSGHDSDGHHHDDVFIKDLGNGQVVLTHVFWAEHSH